ncbi:MAG: family 10 glycosylhydrolase [Gemmatimonadota bacterium]
MRPRATFFALVLCTATGCTVVGAPAPLPAPPPAGPDATRPGAGDAPRPEQPPEAAPTDAAAAGGAYTALRPVRSFAEVRGLWVIRSSMTSEAEVRAMVDRAAVAGFNTLVVQVRGRADAFYRSSLEPRAQTLTGPADFDPLALAIEEGHRRGLAVHAWVNTHLVWGPAAPPASQRHILNARPDWLGVPRALGSELYTLAPNDPRYVDALRRYADTNRATVEGIYTSPSHPEVQARVHGVWMELLERYDLDGIHFDYIRFPSGTFDYSRGALERFRAWVAAREGRAVEGGPGFATWAEALAFVDARPEAWAEFRREQITGLVRRIYRDVKARRPEVVVSAAVIADADDAYRHRFQDWRGWLAEGILDIAVPMAYTTDNGRFDRQVAEARDAAGERERTWAGIGAWLNGIDGTLQKIDLARARGVGGIVLFSYDWAVTAASGEDEEPFLSRIARERFGGR